MFSRLYFLSVWALVYREVVRFFRQMSRVIGALGTPLLFWFLIGSGVGTSFQSPFVPEGMSYLEFLFPGTLALILLMTAMFSSISIIQDRQEGFLQSILVAPVASGTLVGGSYSAAVCLVSFRHCCYCSWFRSLEFRTACLYGFTPHLVFSFSLSQ